MSADASAAGPTPGPPGERRAGVAAKLAGFAALLAVVFGAAFGIGAATAPAAESPATTVDRPTATTMPAGHGSDHGEGHRS